jgi:predicted metalloprotease with PDZ domain
VPETFVAAVPGTGASVQKSFDKQPEIIAFEAGIFGRYPFTASGGIVPDLAVGFALENQTRPTYSRLFFQFGDGGNDGVVVHELAHQWFGDSLTVNSWRDIWLNEGFATYAEWLWGETQGNGTPQEIFDFLSTIPADDAFWTGAVGDPGTARLFDDLVYTRGAMTLQALRMQVGDVAFFRILRDWARTQAGSTVSTREFVALAERVSHQDLDAFFAAWLSEGKPAGLPEAPPLAALRAAQPAPMPITLSNEIDRSKVQATARALTRASGR